MGSTRPSFAIGIESIKKSFVDAKSRGVKLRYLTEIIDANISYCEEIMSIVDEVRYTIVISTSVHKTQLH